MLAKYFCIRSIVIKTYNESLFEDPNQNYDSMSLLNTQFKRNGKTDICIIKNHINLFDRNTIL